MVRPWKPEDRDKAVEVVRVCVAEYGLIFERPRQTEMLLTWKSITGRTDGVNCGCVKNWRLVWSLALQDTVR